MLPNVFTYCFILDDFQDFEYASSLVSLLSVFLKRILPEFKTLEQFQKLQIA